MTEPLRLPAARSAPEGLAATTDWFESLSYGLVLLEPYPLEDLQAAVQAFRGRMIAHTAAWGAERWVPRGGDPFAARLYRVVVSDHAWFETSFDQLRWFLGIVENEDHGGHRQALGQYGRLVSEAVRRHLGDEQSLAARALPSAKG